MKTTTARALTLALSPCVIALFAAAAHAETTDCTPITSLPYVITVQGVYCFTGNLATSMTSGHAIDIQTSNVTIDLNGFKLGGLAAGLGTTANGIHANQQQNITIRNGIVRGFKYGVELGDAPPYTTSQGHLLEDLVVDQNTQVGIQVRGRGCVVRRNQVVTTGGSPSFPGLADGINITGPGNQVLNNRVAGTIGTLGSGIFLGSGDGCVIKGNRLAGDNGGTDYGIYIQNSSNVLVVGNRITATGTGILFTASTGKYMNNLTSGVATPFNGGTAVGTNN